MAKYKIVLAEPHPITHVNKEFYNRTEAKKEKKGSVIEGKQIPGFLLKLKKKLNYTLIWMDLEMCVERKLLPNNAVCDLLNAKELEGQKIIIKKS